MLIDEFFAIVAVRQEVLLSSYTFNSGYNICLNICKTARKLYDLDYQFNGDMSVDEQKNSSELDELLNNAKDLTDNRTVYVNNVRHTIGLNEATVDFYIAGPNPSDPHQPQAFRTHRIVMPISLAKQFAINLLKSTDQWEEMFGITLPFDLQPPSSTTSDE